MRKNKKNKKLLLLLLLLMAVTIGYALLSTTLKINGTAGIKKNTWNIHWDPTSYQQSLGGGATATTPTYNSDNTQINYGVTLELPGDYYEFTIDAVNEGTISGKIAEISHTVSYIEGGETKTTLPSYILYSIEYADQPGVAPAEGDILDPGATQKYKIRLEFDPNSSVVIENPLDITITEEEPYEQTKERKVTPDPDYGGEATNADAQLGLFFYEINNDGDHTASIVAVNYAYTADLKEVYAYAFGIYDSDYNLIEGEALGTEWIDGMEQWNTPEAPKPAPDYYKNMVIPKKVKLNNEGKYAPNGGEEYTITRVYSNYGYSYYSNQNVSQAKYEYINANNGTSLYNLNWNVESLIVPDTVTYFDSGLTGYRMSYLRQSKNQQNLSDYWANWSDAVDPRLSVYIPKAVTSVDTYTTYHGEKSNICAWGVKVKTLYIPNSVTNLGGSGTLLHAPSDNSNENNPCDYPPNIVAQDSTVAALIQASGYGGNLTVDGSKFN